MALTECICRLQTGGIVCEPSCEFRLRVILRAVEAERDRYKAMVEPKYPLIADCAKCRDCGDPVHDFHVRQELWDQVIGGPDGVWCWDCFADRADQKGLLRGVPVLLTDEEVDAVVAVHPHIFGG